MQSASMPACLLSNHLPLCLPAFPPLPACAQVYVTVFADGPTRVLRFSDDKNVSSLEAQNIILDLAARLKQVGGWYLLWLPCCRAGWLGGWVAGQLHASVEVWLSNKQ